VQVTTTTTTRKRTTTRKKRTTRRRKKRTTTINGRPMVSSRLAPVKIQTTKYCFRLLYRKVYYHDALGQWINLCPALSPNPNIRI